MINSSELAAKLIKLGEKELEEIKTMVDALEGKKIEEWTKNKEVGSYWITTHFFIFLNIYLSYVLSYPDLLLAFAVFFQQD